jgi:hypothetical protein
LSISSFCFSPADSARTGWSSGTAKGMRAMNAVSAAFSRRQSMTRGASSRLITRFSAALSDGTRVKC